MSRLPLTLLVLATCITLGATPTIPRAEETEKAAPTVLWRSDAALVEAENLIRQGKYVDALTYLDQVIARNMHNLEAHVHTALVWYHLGNMDKALTSLKSAALIDRNHIGAAVIHGMIALKQDNISEANDYLSAIRMLCRSETCPEYQTLQRMIRETPEKERSPWYRF